MQRGLIEFNFQVLNMLSIALEGMRSLTRWFMRRPSIVRRACWQQQGRTPPLCDLIWAQASPAIKTCQYFSALLAGKSSRLILVWSRRHDSWEEFCEAEPELLFIFRRVVMCIDAWAWFIFVVGCMRMPWLLAALIDYRRTDLDLMVAELSRLMSSDELNDEWFGTPFWNLLERDKEALRSPDVTQAIWLWSWETLCTACQNEFTHSRNKRRADASLSWSNFVGSELQPGGATKNTMATQGSAGHK